jgi:hypothetical protein
MTKILVYTPLHPQTPKLYGRTNQSIFRLDYEPLEYLFSKGDNPHDTGNAKVDGRLNVLHNYTKAFDYVRSGDWDYLLTVEYDMVVPDYAITRLLDCDADIAFGVYVFRGNNRWSAYTRVEAGYGESISQDEQLAARLFQQRARIPVQGVGWGCTLIRRKVVEEVDLRGYQGAACDWYFAIDCVERGYKMIADLGVICGHINASPSPRVLWPDPVMPGMYRNDFIDGVPTNDKGEIELIVGQFGEFYVPKDVLLRPVSSMMEEIQHDRS